ncbi:MAG TPA: response regulator transcription factor [Candidatus Sulfotelmatobacter sp.]|nr:response regulator transcription factor [Candidatus Sulfotelmatobacter sp.]HWI56114.1 response regulator transcription factor [Bacillota bacterium]
MTALPASASGPQNAGAQAGVPSPKASLKVALVEDQPKVRESWTRLINSFPDFRCVCACGSGEEALRVIPPERPDVVLMDIFLPRMSGIECTVRLKEQLAQTQIVILTAMDDQELVFMALEAGADGYLLKRTKPADLRQALLDVLGGGAPMTSQIARRVIESFRRKARNREQSALLSLREEQILRLLSQGYSNKLIADKLELSIDTVCSHLKRVFEKLHVSSRTEAVVRYMASRTPPQHPEDSL